jgi:hypothetical protein
VATRTDLLRQLAVAPADLRSGSSDSANSSRTSWVASGPRRSCSTSRDGSPVSMKIVFRGRDSYLAGAPLQELLARRDPRCSCDCPCGACRRYRPGYERQPFRLVHAGGRHSGS